MNQKLIVGIGNIYANEILFDSKIHPLMLSKFLINSEPKYLRFNFESIK